MNGKKVHIIGLAGAGMSALATIMRDAGWQVSGSDQGLYDPIEGYLERQGFSCHVGHKPENIPDDADMIVIGKHAKLVSESNAEVARAFSMQNQGKTKVVSLPEAMADIAASYDQYVVCGSYGKSTCTALAAYLLDRAGRKPSYFIGALPLNFDQHGRKDVGSEFIIEGDEYPSSNWDNTSKFLHYSPVSVLLTSGEHDHVNVFPTEDDYLCPYKSLLKRENLKTVVGCADNPHVLDLLSETSAAHVVTYGLIGSPDWKADNIIYGQETIFSVYKNAELQGELSTQLLGQHNIQNILGVVVWLIENELASFKQIQMFLPGFRGITRRLDRKSDLKAAVSVYEGFGSSYTKAKTAIDAMRLHFPRKKLVVLFEPHTFSWRDEITLSWYDSVFEDVNGQVLVYKPPIHGAATHQQLSLEQIVQRIQAAKVPVSGYEDYEAMAKAAIDAKPEIVLLLTSGSFDGNLANFVKLFS